MRKLNIGVAARLALVLALSAGMCTWTIPLSVFADEPAESHEANMVASNQDKTGEAAEKPEATETTPIPDELGTVDSQDPSPIDEAASTADARNDAIPPETIVQPAEDTVGFTYIESSSLTSGDTQNIAIALSDEKTVLSSATITISHDGSIQTLPSSAISGNAAKFTMESVSSGKYALKSFAYSLSADDATHVVDLAPHGLSFDVDSQASDDGADTTVYEIDSSGTLAESKEMTDEVNKATDTSPLSTRQQSRLAIARPKLLAVAAARTDFSSHPVVCIDAGHGGDDSGALGHGLQEKDLNLKIANYCKTALEQKGVRVVMTRTGDTCPSLAERTKIAVNAGANYFVSIHINSAEDAPSANGCEVWVPNDSSYRSDVRASGEVLGKEIDQKLAALGLRNRGIKTKDSSERTYSDGHAADYYAVIRQGRQAGIPSVIVEHAFITNSSDAKKLSNDSWLKQLGKADAAGILSALSNDKRPAGQSGWFKDGGAWYYMDPSGAMRTGWLKDGGTWYYMDPSGAMRTGWLKYGGAWYYLDASGAMRTGWAKDGALWYYMDPSGAMRTGWLKDGGTWYYMDPSGAMRTGWLKYGGAWYYLDASGAMRTGVVRVGGEGYLLAPSGAMRTGWAKEGGTWYLAGPSGALRAGWAKDGGTWYYLDPQTFAMRTGWAKDGALWYYMDPSGAMRTGWLKDGGTWYYMDPSGAMRTGWLKYGGAWYYLDASGAMRTGWAKDGGTWYYMGPSGAMRTGWLKYGGAWYYLDASGAMRTGTSTIDGVRYTFNSDGSLAEDKTTDYAIMGDSATSVNEMVRLYKSSGASYHSNVYKNKGAASIEEFCQIVYEEARAEGVRAEVVFCQEMNETNWLRFGGDVKAEQCNFAGLGATGNGVPGNTFPDVRTGVRAQVQHLKAYASTEPLKNKCVDTRFGYVSRGSAPTVLKLSGTWAASKSYGQDLLKLIDELQSIS